MFPDVGIAHLRRRLEHLPGMVLGGNTIKLRIGGTQIHGQSRTKSGKLAVGEGIEFMTCLARRKASPQNCPPRNLKERGWLTNESSRAGRDCAKMNEYTSR